jgi:hypothetical protein
LISSTTIRAGAAQGTVVDVPFTPCGTKGMTAVLAATAIAEGAYAGGGLKDIKAAGGADGGGWNVVLVAAGTLVGEAETATKSCNLVSHSVLFGIPMSERLWFELAI